MFETLLPIIEIIQLELLLFCVVWFLIGGLDDILVDMIWMIRWCYRRATIYRHKKPMILNEFIETVKYQNNQSQGKAIGVADFHAIFIPAWREANVIGEMLQGCKRAWMDGDVAHRIYVGCYPNDPTTVKKVIEAAKSNPYISLILCRNDGPTTKADCLNHLWQAMLRDELNQGIKAISVILHDAEDRPHQASLAIFDRLIGQNDIVQLPVIPIPVSGSQLVSGHYCDEFCESHGKAMVVREAIGAALPLAGVGCAIERNCLGRFALERNNIPFDSDSVTEDYELGLNIGSTGRGAIMVRMNDDQGQLIGTRSFFPTTLHTAVIQKTRWTLGIALSGWNRMGWVNISKPQNLQTKRRAFYTDGRASRVQERRHHSNKRHGLYWLYNMGENWMRFRDRRGIFSALTVCCAYVLAILSGLLMAAQYSGSYEITALSPMMQTMVWITSFILFWRFLMRTAFLYYHYGFGQACLALPRMITSNIISILAARRAVMIYIRYCFGGTIRWEKTEHNDLPSDQNHAQPTLPSHVRPSLAKSTHNRRMSS